jgi:hypothetical protein
MPLIRRQMKPESCKRHNTTKLTDDTKLASALLQNRWQYSKDGPVCPAVSAGGKCPNLTLGMMKPIQAPPDSFDLSLVYKARQALSYPASLPML